MSATTTKHPTEREPERKADEPAASGRPRLDRAMLLLVVVLGLAVAVNIAWRLWLVRDVHWLTVRADEDGYLVVARALTGGSGGTTTENPLFRHVGYPLIIAPVYWFAQEPMSVYKGVQILNAVISSLTLPLAFVISRRIFSLPRVLAAAVAIVAAAVPAVVFHGEFAMTDAVLPTLLLLWVLALYATVTATEPRRELLYATLCGAAGGLLWLVHVRSIVILIVQVVVFAILAFRRRLSRRAALASLGGIGLSVLVDIGARIAIGGQIRLSGESPSGTLFVRLLNPFGLVHTINWAVGQLWYLTVATLGLAAIGGAAVVMWVRQRDPSRRGRDIIVITVLAVTVGIAFFSAATLPDTERINLYAYGRYVAFTAPLWIIIAVAALADSTIVRSARLIGAGAVTLLVSVYVVVSYSGRLRTDTFFPFDAPEASVMTNSWGRLRLAAVTAVVLFALVWFGILLTFRRTRLAALGIALLLSVAAMPVITANAAAPMSLEFAPGIRLVEDAGVNRSDRVAADSGLMWWVEANNQWQVYWGPIAEFNAAVDRPPADATVVIASWRAPNSRPDWDGAEFGWRLVAVDDKSGCAIWRR